MVKYIVTKNNAPIAEINIYSDLGLYVYTVDEEQSEPIYFPNKLAASKMALALTWLENSYDYGWEKVNV